VGNAAYSSANVAPGELGTALFLGPPYPAAIEVTGQASSLPLPTDVQLADGTSVSFWWGSVPPNPSQKVELLYWSPSQINFIIPSKAAASVVGEQSFLQEQRRSADGKITTYPALASTTLIQAPAIFAGPNDGTGLGLTRGAITDAVTGKLVGLTNPIVADTPYSIWVTGLGPKVLKSVITPTSVTSLMWASFIPTVTVSNTCFAGKTIQGEILFAGSGPFPGLDQINFLIPADSLRSLAAPPNQSPCIYSNEITIQVNSSALGGTNSNVVNAPTLWP
jgi:uncharacterized protein (TIGR03437 family)